MYSGCMKEPCRGIACLNGGECVVLADGTTYCICEPGFDGTFCEKNAPCDTIPCVANATCIDSICVCITAYEGEDCETEKRLKYFGEYDVIDSCQTDIKNYNCLIFAHEKEVGRFWINNLVGEYDTVYADITDTFNFYIPSQFLDTLGTLKIKSPSNSKGVWKIEDNSKDTILTMPYLIIKDKDDTLQNCKAYFIKK